MPASPMMHSAARALMLATMLGCAAVAAHPVKPVSPIESGLQAEIEAFREAFRKAASERDAVALRGFYTDDFTHTHTSGKVDGKDVRIVSVIAADQTVEMAPSKELMLSCFGESVCIVRALSPIKRGTDGRWFDVRWTQTYVKTEKGWQIAISQATGLPQTVRDEP